MVKMRKSRRAWGVGIVTGVLAAVVVRSLPGSGAAASKQIRFRLVRSAGAGVRPGRAWRRMGLLEWVAKYADPHASVGSHTLRAVADRRQPRSHNTVGEAGAGPRRRIRMTP